MAEATEAKAQLAEALEKNTAADARVRRLEEENVALREESLVREVSVPIRARVILIKLGYL